MKNNEKLTDAKERAQRRPLLTGPSGFIFGFICRAYRNLQGCFRVHCRAYRSLQGILGFVGGFYEVLLGFRVLIVFYQEIRKVWWAVVRAFSSFSGPLNPKPQTPKP